MSKLKDILRLKYESNLSARQIARALNVSHTVVNNYLSKTDNCSKKYEELKDLNNKEIISNLFPLEPKKYKYTPPNFAYIHKELRRKGVYRLEQVSSAALQTHRYRVDDIKQILKNDKQSEELTTKILEHKFVRGSSYYN